MNLKTTIAIAAIVASASSAFAQQPPRTYDIRVSGPEAQIILNLVSQMSIKDGIGLFQRVAGQIQEQDKQAAETAKTAPAPIASPATPKE